MQITSKTEELLHASREIGVASNVLPAMEGRAYINNVLKRFNPQKTSGHLSIYNESTSIPLEGNEFTYSKFLGSEPAYVFFAQEGIDADKVLVVEQADALGSVFENAYGMEYFVSNKEIEYLLAVNWYVIEGSGSAVKWINNLKTKNKY